MKKPTGTKPQKKSVEKNKTEEETQKKMEKSTVRRSWTEEDYRNYGYYSVARFILRHSEETGGEPPTETETKGLLMANTSLTDEEWSYDKAGEYLLRIKEETSPTGKNTNEESGSLLREAGAENTKEKDPETLNNQSPATIPPQRHFPSDEDYSDFPDTDGMVSLLPSDCWIPLTFYTLIVKMDSLERMCNSVPRVLLEFFKESESEWVTNGTLCSTIAMGFEDIEEPIDLLKTRGMQCETAPVDFYVLEAGLRINSDFISPVYFISLDDGELEIDKDEWKQYARLKTATVQEGISS